jgi:hypothetical protein
MSIKEWALVFLIVCLAASLGANYYWYSAIKGGDLINKNKLIVDGKTFIQYMAEKEGIFHQQERWRQDVANIINFNLNQKVLKEPPDSIKVKP